METPGLGEEGTQGSRERETSGSKPSKPQHPHSTWWGHKAKGPALEMVIRWESIWPCPEEGWSCPSTAQPITACCSLAF